MTYRTFVILVALYGVSAAFALFSYVRFGWAVVEALKG